MSRKPQQKIEPLVTQESASSIATFTPRTLVNAITIEFVAYVLLFVLALLMRFVALDTRPLAAHEAASALASWQFLQGNSTGFVGSPLLFSANLLLFMLGGAADATARFVPALIGSAVVLLPVLIRRELGRTGGLITSVLLLFSGSLVFFARDLNGVEVGAVVGFAAAIWLWHYTESGHARDLYLGVVAAAFALTASAAGYTILLAGVIAAIVWRGRMSPRTASETNQPGEWRNAAVLFSVVYVGAATAGLLNREGLGAAFNLLGDWLVMFRTIGPLTLPLNLLLVYEPHTFVFGLAGVLLLPSLLGEELRARGVVLFFAIAFIVGLIVYSLAGVKSNADVVVLTLSLAVLAGWFIGNLLERGMEEIARGGGARAMIWGEMPIFAMALLVAPLAIVQWVSFLQQNRFSPGLEVLHQLIAPGAASSAFDPAAVLLGGVTLLISILIAVLSVGTIGVMRTSNLAAMAVAVLLLMSGVRALWLANYSGAGTVHELLASEQTGLQARDLVRDLETQSMWRAGDTHVINARTDESLGPVARWYLRAFPNVQWVKQPQATEGVQALITKPDATTPPGAWISQRYQMQMNWILPDVTRVQLFRWLLFRDGGTETWQSIKLWVPQPE